jgi:hypothetical protein
MAPVAVALAVVPPAMVARAAVALAAVAPAAMALTAVAPAAVALAALAPAAMALAAVAPARAAFAAVGPARAALARPARRRRPRRAVPKPGARRALPARSSQGTATQRRPDPNHDVALRNNLQRALPFRDEPARNAWAGRM